MDLEAHRPAARRIAAKYCNHAYTIDDLEQEALINLWNYRDRIESAENPIVYGAKFSQRRITSLVFNRNPFLGEGNRGKTRDPMRDDLKSVDVLVEEGWDLSESEQVDAFAGLPHEAATWIREKVDANWHNGPIVRRFRERFPDWEEML